MSAETLDERDVCFVYTNWRGVCALRRVRPECIYYGTTPHHTESQWLLLARDLDKGADRSFALSGIREWRYV